MQISDIFNHHKNMDSIFTEKPEEILSFLMILDENPKFSQNSSKICIFKILINYKKKRNGPPKKNSNFFILLDLFYDCQFSSQSVF